MMNIQEIVVKLSYFGFTRTCGEVVVSECHVIPSPVNLIRCPVKCVGTANLVVKLSVTRKPVRGPVGKTQTGPRTRVGLFGYCPTLLTTWEYN